MSEGLNDFRRLAATRRSIRRFTGEPVDAAGLRAVLETACLAASAHNRQPWRFVVIESSALRSSLVDALAARHRRDLEADGVDPGEAASKAMARRDRILNTPTLVLLCLTTQDMRSYPDRHRTGAERLMAIQSAALAGDHLLLAAHAAGWGACWLCAPLFAADVFRQELDLPPVWEPQALFLLGRPAETPDPPARLPLEDVVVWR
jgi:coenzyme F420-0:L-glutamate ligase/coenzyme F420-1:gamma-L-glutamate ligase